MAGIEGLIPVQQAFNGGEVSQLVSARIEQPRFQAGCKTMLNCYPMAQGPATRRPGFRYLGEVKEADKPVRLFPFVFSAEQARVLEFGVGYVRFWTSTGYVVYEGKPYEVATPYTENDIPTVDIAQSADVIYIASENHPPRKLSRYGDTAWRLEEITFAPSIEAPASLSLSATGSEPASGKITYYYRVTAVDKDTGDESYPSEIKSITTDALSQTWYVKLTAGKVDNAVEYRFYKLRGGTYGFIGRSADGVFEDRNIQADTADGPPVEKEPFKEEGNYPRRVFLWQQRLGWASSNKHPLTIWMSRTANYENLSAASPPKDDDGIEVTLASESQDRIAWLMGENSLLMGTTGAEYTITGTDGSSALTPTSFSFSRQSNFGSEEIGAIFAAGKVLYAQRTTSEVREFGYNYEQDRYISPSMLILAAHLIENNKIVEWEWQQSESLLWCVMEDGTLIACTYMMEHEVIGWHKHTTDGKVLHACCIPGERKDLLFAVIEREISGVKKKYIEMLSPPFVGSNLKDAFFVDCGATYDGEETSRICGLDYLEGKEVSIFCDGASMPSRIIKNGCIDLDYPVKWAHIGLPYYTLLIPNRPEVATEQGAPQGRIINIPKALVRFYRSMNVRVGSEGRKCDDAIKHLSADPVNPQLMSGDVDVAVMGGWSSSRSIQVEVSDPVPMTVVCIVYGLKVSPSI